ncbi:temptin [Plakobranchus ocellatus]|uniref:Temptin n=1 Tax=Plakobranchus ocellatus TaxID=259542 RepID=A0AAV4C5N0_9GAST|nr:temptin [Plakobranchus ocellatus]
MLYLSAVLLTCTAMLLDTPGVADAFPSNRDRIPNGYRVADPCRPGRTAQGVGHKSPYGGGPLNVFGNAFAAAGGWTSALCNADSDGDGVSNGAELGDPSCTWTQGQTPDRTTDITHPAINNNNPSCPIPPWLWKLFFGWTIIFEQQS